MRHVTNKNIWILKVLLPPLKLQRYVWCWGSGWWCGVVGVGSSGVWDSRWHCDIAADLKSKVTTAAPKSSPGPLSSCQSAVQCGSVRCGASGLAVSGNWCEWSRRPGQSASGLVSDWDRAAHHCQLLSSSRSAALTPSGSGLSLGVYIARECEGVFLGGDSERQVFSGSGTSEPAAFRTYGCRPCL